MRSNTDRKPSRLAPVLAALGTILVVFILVGLAVVGGVLAALIQRLREIKRGEEEDAKKY